MARTRTPDLTRYLELLVDELDRQRSRPVKVHAPPRFERRAAAIDKSKRGKPAGATLLRPRHVG
jgi:hypothetical protein